MIQRVVLIWFADGVEQEERQTLARTAAEILGSIELVRRVEVGLQVDIEAGFDMSIVLLFHSLEDIQRYIPHPEHRRLVDEILRPRIGGLKMYNFRLIV
ncbi:Dabb family protein [bacterium AH-315-M10]|nr:Dabb family protein [bacterium AH-315-M10]